MIEEFGIHIPNPAQKNYAVIQENFTPQNTQFFDIFHFISMKNFGKECLRNNSYTWTLACLLAKNIRIVSQSNHTYFSLYVV